MTRFIMPVLWFALGLALLAYGAAHPIRSYPGPEVFRAVLSHVPEAASIGLFLLGVLAAIGGVALMCSGGRGVRERWSAIERAYGEPAVRRHHHGHDPDDDWYGEPHYR